MKRLLALLLLLLVLSLPARAQNGGPDDQYVVIYSLIQQADSSDSSGQSRQALPNTLPSRPNCKNSPGSIRIGIPGSSIFD